jgi:hypothetical protein
MCFNPPAPVAGFTEQMGLRSGLSAKICLMVAGDPARSAEQSAFDAR